VKANVYVDGLSLYYSALKRTPYKWLDLRKLARLLLPGDRIHRIRYFTSLRTCTTTGRGDSACRRTSGRSRRCAG
jgi:hypothetical protein